MKFTINGKKVTEKEVKEVVGEARFVAMKKDAKQTHLEDPYTEISYMTKAGMLNIEVH